MRYRKKYVLLLAVLCIFLGTMTPSAAKPSWYNLTVGRKYFIAGEIWYMTFKEKKNVSYSFYSDNPEVFRVTRHTGMIKAIAKGTATLTIKAKKKTKKGTIVYQKQVQLNVGNVRLNKTETTIRQGMSRQLKICGFPYLKKRKITWSSSDESVAKVSSGGVITAVGEGTAQISVVIEGRVHLSCQVTVTAITLPDAGSIVLLNENGVYGAVSLKAMMEGEMKTVSGTFSCVIEDPLMGSVVNGLYRAKYEGTNIVTAKYGQYTKRFIIYSKKWNAHRGFMDICPENTIAAYSQAAKAGAYSMEADVRFTNDQVPVMLHERNLSVMTDGIGKVDKLSYEEIRTVSVAKGNGLAQCTDRHIPTLDEFLQICKNDGVIAILDVKKMHVPQEQIEEQCRIIYQALSRYGMLDRTMILSSYPENLAAFRKVCGERVVCVCSSREDAIDLTKEGVPGISYFAENGFGITELTDTHPIVPAQGLGWRTFRSAQQTDEEQSVS